MLTKELFCSIINRTLSVEDFILKASQINIDLFATEVYEYAMDLQSTLLKEFFTDEGVRTIEWWLYEHDRTKPGIWDKDGNIIPVYTVDELWDFLKDDYIKK